MPATQQQINYGAVVNDGQGDPLRTAFIKTDDNFDAIWAAGPVGSNVTITNNTITATNTNGELRLQTNGVGNVRIARPFIPTGNRLYDLGAANLRFGTVYANTLDTINFAVSTLTVNNIKSDDSAFVQINDGLDVNGNVSAQYFIGDGSQLTNLPGGGGDYGNSNVAAYLSTGVAVNIVPAANAVWSLGNATNQWANLWVSNNTIYIGNVAVGVTAGNVLTVGGEPVLTNDSDTSITTTGNITANIITAPGAINVGNMVIGTVPGDITADANTGVTFNVSGPDGGFAVGYLKEVGNANTSGGELAFNSELGNATYRISLSDDFGNGFATKIWRFDGTGNLTLPDNTFAVNYANGTQVSLGGGGNTGNVTFNDQVVQGTGNPEGGDGLYLAPGPDSSANLQYLRVRGGDYPTHIHLDTGNNNYFDQYFGDDNKYVKLEATGAIVVNSNDGIGNTAQWAFGTDGNLILPGNTSQINYANGTSVLADYATISSNYSSNATTQSINNPDGGGTYNNSSTLDITYTAYTGASTLNFDIAYQAPLTANIGVTVSAVSTPLIQSNANIQIQANTGTAQTWTFDTAGDMSAPGNITAPYIYGNTTEANVFVGGTANILGNVTAGNILTTGSGGDITMTGGDILGVNIVVTTPTALANLTAVSGGRAFVNDGNLAASGNFGNLIGSGGSNVVPVWSDGSNWYIG